MNPARIVAVCLLVFVAQSGHCQNKIWGMTAMGGTHGFGVIFTTNADGSDYRVIHHFDSVNGKWPESKLLKAPNGKLYGTTHSGGIHNDGVLFEIDPNGNFHKKIDFHDATIGSRLQGGLVLGQNGKLYGATWSGGTNYDGTIFEYDVANGTLKKLTDLNNEGLATGAFPFGSFVRAYNGKYYGTCYAGGKNTLGVIFELDPATGIVTKKFDFDFQSGDRPAFNVTLATDGKLYGVAGGGGVYGFGTIFAFDPLTSTCEKLHDFDGPATGAVPIGTLTLAYDGKLYGTTSWGGKNNTGIVFEFNYRSRTIVKRFEFDDINSGKAPRGGLLQSSNGKFYGTTEQGGVHSQGVLFEFDPSNGRFIKKLDFSSASGGSPQSNELTLLRDRDERTVQAINFDPEPTLDIGEPIVSLPATATSGLPVVYYSDDPAVASILNNELKIYKTGSVTITATQSGNADFLPAPDVARLLKVDSVAKTNLITGIMMKPEASFDVIVKENPFSGSLKFQVNSKDHTANIVMYSMIGQRVHESQARTNTPIEFQMDFKPGIYVLGVETQQGRKLLRLLCK